MGPVFRYDNSGWSMPNYRRREVSGALLIRDARIVTDGTISEGDVFVRGERIEANGGDQGSRPADEVIDARGKFLLPGMIDDHVHFREPGLTHKGDIAHESRAAIAGGVTSFMEMPNTVPPTTSPAALDDKMSLAAATSAANYAFYLGATADNLDAIRRAHTSRACGVKLFMGASTGDLLVDDRAAVARIFAASRLPVAVHCEDTAIVERNAASVRASLGEFPSCAVHAEIRSVEACFASTSLAVEIAREIGSRLHVLHVSTADELELFDRGPLEGKRITAEACVHHLWFDAGDYEALGARIKCNPAIKGRPHRDALRAALTSGEIDVIGTDHAPHLLEEKSRGYFAAPSGVPCIQHALTALLDLHLAGVLPLELVAERACHGPARLFGIRDRGYLREGYYADLALVDLARPCRVERETLLSTCGWSPFEGTAFRASVDTVVVNGRVAYRAGRLAEGIRGLPLELDRSRFT
jgi:dihydroorotase